MSMIYIFFGVYAVTAIVFCFLLGSSDEKIERLERKQKLLEARVTDYWQELAKWRSDTNEEVNKSIAQFKEEIALIHSHLGVEKIVDESVEKPIVGQIAKGGFKGGDMFKLDEVENQYGESYIKKTAKLKKKTNKLKR